MTLLLVSITPSFFRSPACRGEVERFLAREHELGRQDLILPVYYVSTPELDEPERRDADELARVLASRQFVDWRELRFEPFTAAQVRKALAQLAGRMRDRRQGHLSLGPCLSRRGVMVAARPASSVHAGRGQAMGGDQDLPTGPLPDGITIGDDGVARCWWGAGDPLYRPYHDTEWGRPVADDRRLFEKLSLEGFQAGLSWLTILRKREQFREVFAGFDPATVAQFGIQEVERLLADPGIVRNRAKIEATINNARRYDDLAAEFGSLAAYVWRFEPDPQARPPVLDHAALLQLGQSPESKAMSKDLRRRGWSFVGPTTVYAFMQAMGLVNDHLEGCDRRAPVERERHRFRRPSVAADEIHRSVRAQGRS